MHETEEFIRSLQHDNSDRPRFSIEPDKYEPKLRIQYLGQSMEVPMAEVLHFAATWQADQDRKWAQNTEPRLRIHPYPLYNVRMDDPDRGAWWVPPDEGQAPKT